MVVIEIFTDVIKAYFKKVYKIQVVIIWSVN